MNLKKKASETTDRRDRKEERKKEKEKGWSEERKNPTAYSDLLRARLVQYASKGAVTTASNSTSSISSLSPMTTRKTTITSGKQMKSTYTECVRWSA